MSCYQQIWSIWTLKIGCFYIMLFTPCLITLVIIVPLGLITLFGLFYVLHFTSFTWHYGWWIYLFAEEWMVLCFTFYTLPSFYELLSTDWVNLNIPKGILLHFAFYTMLHSVGHNHTIMSSYIFMRWYQLTFTPYSIP